MKKLGMSAKAGAASTPAPAPAPKTPPHPGTRFPHRHRLLTILRICWRKVRSRLRLPAPAPPPAPATRPDPVETTPPGQRDFRESLGKLLSTMGKTQKPEEPSGITHEAPQPQAAPSSRPRIMPEPVAEEAQPVMARPAAAEPAASQPVPSPAADTVPEQEAPPVRQPVVEIIDEDPKAALRRAKAAKKILPVAAPVEDDQPLSVTDSDEKIVSVDQIKDLSGLILPKGATFQIDELKLHGRINSFDQPARAHSPGV